MRLSKSQLRRQERAQMKRESATASTGAISSSILNIAYLTSRKDPRFHWFTDSLFSQWKDSGVPIKLIVVDFWADHSQRKEAFAVMAREFISRGVEFVHTAPKATVWQGPHRLTKQDYFAPANTRNTALCIADDGWIAYVDDLSVLMPGWFNAVIEARAGGYVACGAYRKVKNLTVTDGIATSFEDHPPGHDHRWKHGSDDAAVPCAPNWHYGCSVAEPVEALLTINGWPEVCDSGGAGMEDCHVGIALANNGYSIRYDRRMLTLEAEELHYVDPPLLRHDKGRGTVTEIQPGVTHPAEKGHVIVRMLAKAKYFENYFGEGGIRALRQRILAGEPFPIMTQPAVDFYDSQPLTEM